MSQPDFNTLASAIEEAGEELAMAESAMNAARHVLNEARAKLTKARKAFDDAVRALRGDPVPGGDDRADDGADLATPPNPRVLPRPVTYPAYVAGMPVAPAFNSNSRNEEERIG